MEVYGFNEDEDVMLVITFLNSIFEYYFWKFRLSFPFEGVVLGEYLPSDLLYNEGRSLMNLIGSKIADVVL